MDMQKALSKNDRNPKYDTGSGMQKRQVQFRNVFQDPDWRVLILIQRWIRLRQRVSVSAIFCLFLLVAYVGNVLQCNVV